MQSDCTVIVTRVSRTVWYSVAVLGVPLYGCDYRRLDERVQPVTTVGIRE